MLYPYIVVCFPVFQALKRYEKCAIASFFARTSSHCGYWPPSNVQHQLSYALDCYFTSRIKFISGFISDLQKQITEYMHIVGICFVVVQHLKRSTNASLWWSFWSVLQTVQINCVLTNNIRTLYLAYHNLQKREETCTVFNGFPSG